MIVLVEERKRQKFVIGKTNIELWIPQNTASLVIEKDVEVESWSPTSTNLDDSKISEKDENR